MVYRSNENRYNEKMIRQTVHFFGDVQGVGFRYTAYTVAKQFTVTGYVRNCSDGSVKLVVEGTDRETKRYLDSIRKKMSGHIDRDEMTKSSPTGEFFGFDIR